MNEKQPDRRKLWEHVFKGNLEVTGIPRAAASAADDALAEWDKRWKMPEAEPISPPERQI
jgi:hypothetical protein